MRIILILLALSACSPNVGSSGHVRSMGSVADVTPNLTTREQVLAAYGSPSAVSSFGQETWYYITAKKESFAFFRPEVVDQEVVKIAFDNGGLVASVDKFDKSAMQEIQLAEKTTPTEGQEMTAIQQLLGNVGRFNAPGSTPGSLQTSGARGRR